jgi:hypothetical protein
MALSGVHSILVVKSAQLGEGGGCTPSPFHSIHHHERSCGVPYASAERAKTLPYFSSTPICFLWSRHLKKNPKCRDALSRRLHTKRSSTFLRKAPPCTTDFFEFPAGKRRKGEPKRMRDSLHIWQPERKIQEGLIWNGPMLGVSCKYNMVHCSGGVKWRIWEGRLSPCFFANLRWPGMGRMYGWF